MNSDRMSAAFAICAMTFGIGIRWMGRARLGDGDELPKACPRPGSQQGELICDGTGRDPMPAEWLATLELAVDVNRASVAELATIDGIGDKMAARIVASRPYASLDELLRVRGIGKKRLEKWRARLSVGPPSEENAW